VTDPKGPSYATSYRYDELNTLTAVDETARGGGVTRYVYDVNRNKIAQQDALGNLVSYEYDELNRLTDMYQYFVAGKINATTGRGDDLGGDRLTALHSHYGYDANGNPNLVIDPMGQHVETTYDYLDRLETVTYSGHADPSLSCPLRHDGLRRQQPHLGERVKRVGAA
jgi:YD repeat-containing protein